MASSVETIDILGGLTLFADLSKPQLEAAAHTFDEEWFNEGERIMRQGFTGGGFYIILQGEAAVQIDGRDVSKLARGDFFGEVSILLGIAPTADVVALGSLRCAVLSGGELEQFLERNPRVMFRMLQTEARRLQSSNNWRS